MKNEKIITHQEIKNSEMIKDAIFDTAYEKISSLAFNYIDNPTTMNKLKLDAFVGHLKKITL